MSAFCRNTLLMLAMVLMAPAPAMSQAEAPLGRLFISPEKRDILDRQRDLNTLENQTSEDAYLLINGQVRRSSGKRTTWINGQAQNDGDTRTGVLALPDTSNGGRVVIESSEDPPTSVKIGDTLNRSTQETASPLGDGKVVVHQRSTPPARQAAPAR